MITNYKYPLIYLIVTVMMLHSTSDILACAQEEVHQYSKSVVYFEGLGQGILYSINYDFRIKQNISLRAGFTHWSITPWFFIMTGDINFTGFPLMVNYLSGKGTHHVEMGLGTIPLSASLNKVTYFFGTEMNGKKNTALGTVTLGYRYQPQNNGIVFRIGLTPFFTFKSAVVSAGISVGYTF